MVQGDTHSNTFTVTHRDSATTHHRSHVLQNPHHDPGSTRPPQPIDPTIEGFHRRLPHYAPTPLTSLPQVAHELGISHVYVKDESLRFGLPSFKILGASWAVYRALCSVTALPLTLSLDEVGTAARRLGTKLVACSAGNWGRAVARMGKYLGIDVVIFLGRGVSEATKDTIRGESAVVIEVDGSYDDAISEAVEESKNAKSLLVMDTSWDGYEQIPQWVVDGYSTMLTETDRQVREACGRDADMCIVPVGVGSVAQAVVAHYNAIDPSIRNIAVEPEAAPCLMESLRAGENTPVFTKDTIMPGMNCGTVSSLAWPVLHKGVHTAVVVSDIETHENVQYLAANGINAGPCGAAALAAARKLIDASSTEHTPQMVLVLFCTEGFREYRTPSTV